MTNSCKEIDTHTIDFDIFLILALDWGRRIRVCSNYQGIALSLCTIAAFLQMICLSAV